MKRYRARPGSLAEALPMILGFIAFLVAMGLAQTLIDGGPV